MLFWALGCSRVPHSMATALPQPSLPVGPPRDAGQPGRHPRSTLHPRDEKWPSHRERWDGRQMYLQKKYPALTSNSFSTGKACFTTIGYKDNKYRFLPLLWSHFHITKKHENSFLTHPFSCCKTHLFIPIYRFSPFTERKKETKPVYHLCLYNFWLT